MYGLKASVHIKKAHECHEKERKRSYRIEQGGIPLDVMKMLVETVIIFQHTDINKMQNIL